MKKQHCLWASCLFISLLICAPANAEKVFDFGKGRWDASLWAPLRLPHQSAPLEMVQRENSFGSPTFPKEQMKARQDNILLMTEAGMTAGEFVISFSLSEDQGTAPGMFIASKAEDGVFKEGFTVFVASYTMACWRAVTDEEKNATDYKHMARLNRYTAPGVKHTLRCRFDTRRDWVALKLDDSDTLMFKGIDFDLTPRIGLWGCHGEADFYELRFVDKPSLEWRASAPE